MLLTVHALTGVALGQLIQSDLLLAPTSFGSHFVLDAVPHFGIRGLDFRTPKGFIIGSLDFAGALTVLTLSLILAPQQASHSLIGWLGATLPDLFYLPEIFFQRRVFPALKAFHHRIQWSESPQGTIVDIVWGGLMIYILYARL